MKVAQQKFLVDNETSKFKGALDQIQEELEDHRHAINENTDEMQANYAHLAVLEEKMDKLHAKVEELILLVQGKQEEKKPEIKQLTKREKEVFQAIYILGEGKPWVSYKQIARRLCTTDQLISGFVTNLIEKGVPIKKKRDSGMIFVQLDAVFRQRQAKDVVIGLNSLLSHWIRPDQN